MIENYHQPEKLFLFLCYKDPKTMIQWLQDAFGFEKVVEYPDKVRGGVNHAELKLGEAVILIQTDHEGYDVPRVKNKSTGRGAVITLGSKEAIRAMHEKAVSAGATSLIAPEETVWGNFRCELLDPEGFQWSFGTYVPGEAPNW